MKLTKQIFLLLALLLSFTPTYGAETEKKGVDLEGILMGHIKDSYEWHVTDIGGKPIVMHFPVIVKSSTGWHVFSSSQFAEEKDANGNRPGPYGLYIANNAKHENKICELVNGQEVRPFDISITKTVMVLFIDAIILLLCILIPARWCKKHKVDDPAPKGFTGLVHMFVMTIYDDVVKPTLKDEADKYAPYLLTCFFFIFTANIMGIVPFPPGGGNLTGNISCTFFLALCTYLITNLTGTKAYWKDIFWGDVPTWLKVPVPLMPVIEFFSTLTKPFALMVRLFANMMAGHAIALSFACIIFVMFGINAILGTTMTVVSVGMSIFMMLLEVLVSYIQALVFTMLSAVFISLAHVKPEHSEQ
ncbi:MAG: F0F1 ATP synthase subunit A [Prevotella sp.]|nr:F0F1 ATP synthase subunit A [Prevotella sp.]